ncbi:hypothetical protein BC830DRAFT_1173485 [Chytriomyces sp. MP71]|nr:hypothetical protein BC830DRAFT_1173485 [Chytriomyces sp. MP71]
MPAPNLLRSILLRVAGLLLLLLLPFTLLAPLHTPTLFAVYYAFLNGVLALSTFRTALGILFAWYSVRRHSFTKWELQETNRVEGCRRCFPASEMVLTGKKVKDHLHMEDVMHVILVPNYKEDVETMADMLRVLGSHTSAKTNYKVCLAMEASEDGCGEKALELQARFASMFHTLTYSIHPKNLPGEMRGKSSNVSWAAKHMAERIPASDAHGHIITATDADSCFTADYFESVASRYINEPDSQKRHTMIFVPIILFDRNSSEVNAFVRMFDTSWSSAHMAFFLPAYPFTPALSSYSVPFELVAAVNFWDVGAEAMAEDMHMTLKLTMATSGRLQVCHVFSPISQCNIVGDKDTFISGTWARLVQLKRHDWGGSLEFTYALRMGISRLFAPKTSTPTRLPRDFFAAPTFMSRIEQFISLICLFYHMWEITVWAIHALMINILAVLLVPGVGPAFLSPIPNAYWLRISPDAPVVGLLTDTFRIVSYIQLALLPTVIIIAIGYEGLYSWCHTRRWILDAQRRTNTEAQEGYTFLGERSALIASPRRWWQAWEWILFLVAAVVFAFTMCWVALLQMGKDELEYVVAAKPKTAPTATAPEVVDKPWELEGEVVKLEYAE